MMYCNVIWRDAAQIHINKILLLQKRAVRILSGAEYLAHTDPLFTRLKLLRIRGIYKYSCCMYVFRNRDLYENAHNRYNTRSTNAYDVENTRLKISERSILHNPPKIYNNLPNVILDLDGIIRFKRSVKRYFLESITQSM